MKNTILPVACATFLAAAAAHAAPFTGKGIPADAVAFVHVDAEASSDGAFSKAIRTMAVDSGKKKSDDAAKVLAELGLTGDFRDFSVGVVPGEAGKTGLSGVFHGTFDAAKFKTLKARHPGIASKTAGGLVWYEADDIASAAGVKSVKKSAPDEIVYVAMAASDTLLFATPSRLEKTAAAATGKAPSYVAPAAAKAALPGSPIVSGWFPESAVKAFQGAQAAPQPGQPSVKSVVFSLGEDAGKVNLAAVATMTDAAGASQLGAQAGMYQAIFGGMIAQQKTTDAKQAADNEFLASLIRALKFSNSGADLRVDFKYDAATLASKLVEKQSDILKAAEAAK